MQKRFISPAITLVLLFSMLATQTVASSKINPADASNDNSRTKLKLMYKEKSGEKSSEFEVLFYKQPDGYTMGFISLNNLVEITGNADFSTNSYIQTDTKNKQNYSIKRSDNALFFSGMENGEKISRTLKIDSCPWYGNIALLMGFALSGKDSEDFYMVIPGDKTATKFNASKEKYEELVLNRKKVRTVKVKITLTDWRSVFWSSYYWFRYPDGILVKTDERRGGPGTPQTVLELVSFQYLPGSNL